MGAAFPFPLVRNRVESSVPHISNHGYFYPSLGSSNYFTTHYYLGSKKFETSDPENYLFGDISDINYMTHIPCPFPYKQPPRKRPVECLNALIFLHKETVKLVRVPGTDQYSLRFKFDSDTKCNVYVICMLSKLVNMDSIKYGTVCDSGTWLSQRYSFDKGLEQDFSESSLTLPLSEMCRSEKLLYDPAAGQYSYPLVIVMEISENSEYEYQSLMTICNVEKSGENDYATKVLKQKFLIDDLEYIFHEIFGLENKATPNETANENDDYDSDDDDDLGAECVICFTDVKDTIILPCRHFCLCASCAADLRYQASNCPICRSPFQALMQIQAVQKLSSNERPSDDDISNNPELYSMPGYKVMSLIQGLNGYPKIKKADCLDSVPSILMSTPSSDEDDHNGNNDKTIEDISITIESVPNNQTVIIFDDDNKDHVSVAKEINTSHGGTQNNLPDLIPPGSIPGTPDEEDSDSVSMVIEANVENCDVYSDRRNTESSIVKSIRSDSTLSSVTTQRTDISSLKSSTSIDSVDSNEALIKKTVT